MPRHSNSPESRSERLSLAAVLTLVNQARRVIESEKVSLPGTAHHRLDAALDGIETEARALLAQVMTGHHTNPALVLYGNPGGAVHGEIGATIGVTLEGVIGFVEQLKYERIRKPEGYYFHDFGTGAALWLGHLADGQKVVVIANVNGRPLWGKG